MVVGREHDKIFMVMEHFDHDLKSCVERHEGPFSQAEVKCFAAQLLAGVRHMHQSWFIHRDIKTSNLLYSNSGKLVICDFGLARLEEEDSAGTMTAYVVTRWYRAPELLYLKQYSEAIDIWSAGCIFAEILGRKAFLQGKNYQDQLNVIFQVVGPPTEQDLEVVPNPEVRDYIRKMIKPGHKQVPLRDRFPKASDKALDLLHKMLAFNPHHRPSAADCLAHPYLSEYHDPEDEPESPETFEWEFEGVTLSKDEIREYMLESVRDIASRLNTSPFLG